MKLANYQIVIAILLAGLAGFLGAVAADRWRQESASGGLHDFVHHELQLSIAQDASLEELEESFAAENARLELALRGANGQLAQAMDREHEYGPEVAAAIDQVHARMGDMQKATVQHVFAMRGILNAEQHREFDRQVSAALTRDPRE